MNCTLISGESSLYLYNNGTLINSGTSPIGNSTLFSSEGLYNITCLYQSTQNYSASSEAYYVNVTQYPVVELINPAASYTNSSAAIINVTFECNATDLTELQNISLYITDNLNTNFALNQTKDITGTSNSSNWTLELGVGTYTWNCLSYDTLFESNWADVNRTIIQNYAAAVETPTGGSSSGGSAGSSGGGGGAAAGGGIVEEPEKEILQEIEETIAEDKPVIEKGDLPLFGGAIALAPEFNYWWILPFLLMLFLPITIYYIKKRPGHSRLDHFEEEIRRRLLGGKSIIEVQGEFVGDELSIKDFQTTLWRIDAVNKLVDYYSINTQQLKELKKFVYQRSKQRLMKEHIVLKLVQVGWNEQLMEYFVSAYYEPPVSLNTTNFIYSR